ncbi:MAG: hypothetical protein GF364_00095 [Candidatus Lokiarchaeota archaeon]|nr:hypothetical protein [Candidatus Lokiarchaeota archaeon]
MKWTSIIQNEKIIFCDWKWVDPGYGHRWSQYRDTVNSENLAKNLEIKQYAPQIVPKPLIKHEFPWEEDYFGPYVCVIEINEKLNLYYECFPSDEGKVHDKDSILCLAQSDDGKNWIKPKLDIFPWNNEYKETNIIYRPSANLHNVGAHGASVFKDPLAPPSEKYKLVYEGKNNSLEQV